MDFSAGIPDTSGMGRAEKLTVMREYRRWRESQNKGFDFSAGPPDVSSMEGAERLAVLRQYRHWRKQQTDMDEAVPSPMPAAGAALPTSAGKEWMPSARPCWEPESASPEKAEHEPIFVESSPSIGTAAGMVSTARSTAHTYFERPATAHSETPRAAPAPWLGAAPAGDAASPGCDAAGLVSVRQGTKFRWLEEQEGRPVSARPQAAQRTEARVLMVDAPVPETNNVETRLKLRLERLRASDDEHAAALSSARPPVAGAAIRHDAVDAAALISAPLPTEVPPLSGLNAHAEAEAKRAWRQDLNGAPSPPPAGSASDFLRGRPSHRGDACSPDGAAAGASSTWVQAKSTRRAEVGAPDSRSAADYNLEEKTRRHHLAPWAGGGERLAARLADFAPSQNENAPPVAVAPPSLDGLTHAAKLARLREWRLQLNAGPPRV
jgi:hypothetical protein